MDMVDEIDRYIVPPAPRRELASFSVTGYSGGGGGEEEKSMRIRIRIRIRGMVQ